MLVANSSYFETPQLVAKNGDHLLAVVRDERLAKSPTQSATESCVDKVAELAII